MGAPFDVLQNPVVTIPSTGIPLKEIERQAIIEALRMSNWIQKAAAALIGISPRMMHYKIKTLDITLPRKRPRSAPCDPRATTV
jgi:transcriptional regulator with GAF, ATPase, and Fis domain